MLSGTFYQKIRKLNKNLKIACGGNSSTPAGLFYVARGEYGTEDVGICAVDKNYLPEQPIYDNAGHKVKGGWRRAVKILIKMRLVDKYEAQEVFGTSFDIPVLKGSIGQDPVLSQIADIEARRLYKEGKLDDAGKAVLRREDILNMSEDLKAARR